MTTNVGQNMTTVKLNKFKVFHMILYGFHMILYDFHMILYWFLYDFIWF